MPKDYGGRMHDKWDVGQDSEAKKILEIKNAIAHCVKGDVSAFVLIKDVPKDELIVRFGVNEEDYNGWKEKYSKGSELIG